MRNLRFLRVYKTRNDGNDRLHIPEEMEFPPCLRLLHWEAYPNKSLPPKFCLQNLVELNMWDSKLEKLWEGAQPLTNLKKMDLSCSAHLKELPDLSKATNLKSLNLMICKALVELPPSIGNLHKLKKLKMNYCSSLEVIPTHINLASLERLYMDECSRLRTFPDFSTNIEEIYLSGTALVELPSSIGNLQKLKELWMNDCTSLEVIPKHINLASLEELNMNGCSRLRTFPDFSTNIKSLYLMFTAVEEVPASIKHSSHLSDIDISGNGNLKSFTHYPKGIEWLDLSNTDIEKISDSIHGLKRLYLLSLNWCRKITSLPKLPRSLNRLNAEECESLQSVTSPLNTPELVFTNCFKLSGEARRLIIQQTLIIQPLDFDDRIAFLPGNVMPSEFNHTARGNSLTFPLSSASFSEFKACVIISPNHRREYGFVEKIRCILGNYNHQVVMFGNSYSSPAIRREHMCIFHGYMPEVSSEAKFEFRIESQYCSLPDDYDIIECGVRIIKDEPEISSEDYDDDSSYDFEYNEVFEDSEDRVIICDSGSENVERKKRKTC